MRKPRIFQNVPSDGIRLSVAYEDGRLRTMGVCRLFFLFCMLILPILMVGCSSMKGGFQDRSLFQEANDLFSQGNYSASLNRYEQIAVQQITSRDRVLFEMGIIHSYPKNERKDYQKAIDCFQRLIKEYPASEYRQNSEMMMFTITNVALKDKLIAAQQTQIGSLHQEVKSRDHEIETLQQRIKALEQTVLDFATRKRSVDRILIEKRERRLMLISKDEVLKTYKIALGGNPDGPKERQGDNKTPEGTYIIDSRNKGSQYHLSLHVSYPNEKDRVRAKKQGVSPGGNIMIHGIKKGFSWVGDSHADVDWTKGCIAVTDEEIEEIFKLTPIGTVVEIRP
ncbi:MAG: L,D-transpeptidase family protein [Desulfuromonadales bacterium]|nr:L,D-transpeptidase family protein [Desulfuromonadales bacterium]